MAERRAPDDVRWRRHQRRYAVRRVKIIAVVAVAAGLLIAADRLGVFGRKPADDRDKYHGKTFTVGRIVDGDTVDVDVPDGRYPRTRVRLWGVDTPETKKPNTPVQHFGPQAVAFTRELCLGKAVRLELETARDVRGRHGRILGWIFLPDGRLLNRELVRGGYAYADPRYDHHLKGELRRLQTEARQSRRGLWKDVTRGDLPYYYREGRHRINLP